MTDETLAVLEAVYHAERFGDARRIDGDITLAMDDAIGRGVTPCEFFAAIRQLEAEGLVSVDDLKDRLGRMTNYVTLSTDGYHVLVDAGRADP